MRTAKKNVLVVAGEFVYPPNHGGRVDIWNRIKALCTIGMQVDLVCTVKEKPKDDDINYVKKYVRNIFFLKRKNEIRRLLSRYPLQIKSRDNLRNISFENMYQLVILEGIYVCSVLKNKTLHYKKIILRMHNDESLYFRELAASEKNIARKLYYQSESVKFDLVEESLLRKIDEVMFISIDEKKKYEKKYNRLKTLFLPAGTELSFKTQELQGEYVLMVSSLFMVNNKEAVQYYIEKIHPLLLDLKGYHLIIAGNSRGMSLKWLYELADKYNNISVYDTPKSLDTLYMKSCVFVNAMLHGAGVKLKTVNAIVNGLPVVATSIGNEGTGLVSGKHILVADEPEKLSGYIRKLILNHQIAHEYVKNAQSFLKEQYDQKKILRKYIENI